MVALPGNHDRFHPATFLPAAPHFETHLAGVPNLDVATRGVTIVSVDHTCVLACIDLSLERHADQTRYPFGYLSQGRVPPKNGLLAQIKAAITSETTHVVVATHFPLDAPEPAIASHECINGRTLLTELAELSESLPVLLISGHWHREKSRRDGNLFVFVGDTASQTLHPVHGAARRTPLSDKGTHAVATVRTEPNGFVVTRWRYADDPSLVVPGVKRFCMSGEVHF